MIHRCKNVSTLTALMCECLNFPNWDGHLPCEEYTTDGLQSSELKLRFRVYRSETPMPAHKCRSIHIWNCWLFDGIYCDGSQQACVSPTRIHVLGFKKVWPFPSVKNRTHVLQLTHIIPAKRVIHNVVVESCCEQRWCRPSRPHLLQQVNFIPKKEKRTKCPLAVTL